MGNAQNAKQITIDRGIAEQMAQFIETVGGKQHEIASVGVFVYLSLPAGLQDWFFSEFQKAKIARNKCKGWPAIDDAGVVRMYEMLEFRDEAARLDWSMSATLPRVLTPADAGAADPDEIAKRVARAHDAAPPRSGEQKRRRGSKAG